jgi:hypothetical protein
VHRILCAAGQNAANVGTAVPGVDRSEYVDAAASAGERLDGGDHPFMSRARARP